MIELLSSTNQRRRELALLMLTFSPETVLRANDRASRKLSAIKSKDISALRQIVEEERAELNALLTSV